MAIDQDFDPVCFLTRAHYHLMKSKRYDAADIAASTILCSLASDLRKERDGR